MGGGSPSAETSALIFEGPAEKKPDPAPVSKKGGWVKDPSGRYFEVEDRQAVLQAYPSYKAVAAKDVEKDKVGYEGAPSDQG